MRSGLGDALRDLFLRALSKKIPPVARVVIEADTIDPGPLKFTLKHAPFLGQRYVFQFVFLMLDVSNLSPDVLKLQGLGIEDADYVVFSKADKVTDEHLRAAELAVKQLNPKAKLVVSVDKLEALLANTLH
jgi:G3E family GTPase